MPGSSTSVMSRKQLLIGLALGLAVLVALVVARPSGGPSGDSEPSAPGSDGTSAEGVHSATSAAASRPSLPAARLKASGDSTATMAGTVRGKVVDAMTGEPVPFVDIVFSKGREEASASSDGSGNYQSSLAAGSYEIRAIGQGVIAKALPVLRVGTAPEMRLDIPVTRLATLRGKVVDPKGRSLADVEILLRSDTKTGAAFPQRGEIGVTTSGSDGSFEIQVPPGAADLEAKLGDTVVFATMPKVASGATLDHLQIVMDRRGVIRGTVTIPGGGLAAGAEVLLSYRREGTSQFENRRFITDGAGQFLARDLAPVTYILEATHRSYAPSGPQVVPLTSELLELAAQLELSAPVSISGQVVDSEGNPVGNAQVAQVWVRSKQRFNKLETYADGEFQFDGLGAGPHMIRARKEGYADAIRKDVMAPIADLQMVLVASGGIEGTVKDGTGAPVQGFTVRYKNAKSGDASSSQFSSIDGSFQAYPVPPGEYTVTIIATKGGLQGSKKVVVPSGGYGDVSMSLTAK